MLVVILVVAVGSDRPPWTAVGVTAAVDVLGRNAEFAGCLCLSAVHLKGLVQFADLPVQLDMVRACLFVHGAVPLLHQICPLLLRRSGGFQSGGVGDAVSLGTHDQLCPSQCPATHSGIVADHFAGDLVRHVPVACTRCKAGGNDVGDMLFQSGKVLADAVIQRLYKLRVVDGSLIDLILRNWQ